DETRANPVPGREYINHDLVERRVRDGQRGDRFVEPRIEPRALPRHFFEAETTERVEDLGLDDLEALRDLVRRRAGADGCDRSAQVLERLEQGRDHLAATQLLLRLRLALDS